MRQENYLYKILSINCLPNGESAEEYPATSAVAEVEFLPESPVYKGHFPGMPITPGVLLLTVAREIVEKVLRISGVPKVEKTDNAVAADQKIVNKEYDNAEGECIVMECAKNVKFLKVLTPDSGHIRFVISELSFERESSLAIDPVNGSSAEVTTAGSDKCLVRAKISIVGSDNSCAKGNDDGHTVGKLENKAIHDATPTDTLYAKMDITYRLTAI